MHFFLFPLVTLSLWQTALAFEHPGGHALLRPLSDDGWRGLSHRSSKRSIASLLKLQDSEHFLWGGPTSNHTRNHVYVNMTMHTADEELILSMERFSSMLASVNCTENMMMTFNSNASYYSAVKSWDWVNFNENRTFILIANYPGCGASTSRQPWVVYNAAYDPKALTVYLNATQQTWQETAHSYDLDFGQYGPVSLPTNSSVRSRDFGVLKYDKALSLNLAHSLPPIFVSTLSVGGFSVNLGCDNCGTKGSLLLSGHVETRWFIPKIFTVSANPKGIEADLNLRLKLSGALTTSGWAGKELRLLTIPLGGFSIPGIMTLGPNLGIDVGIALSKLTGAATISADVVGIIPDSSVFEIDLAGKKASRIEGWRPQFSSSPLDISSSISASAMVYMQLAVALSLELFGTGLAIALNLKVPEVTIQATLVSDAKGVCDSKQKRTGVALDASAGAVLQLQGNTMVAGHVVDNWLSHIMFEETMAYSFASACVGFGEDV